MRAPASRRTPYDPRRPELPAGAAVTPLAAGDCRSKRCRSTPWRASVGADDEWADARCRATGTMNGVDVVALPSKIGAGRDGNILFRNTSVLSAKLSCRPETADDTRVERHEALHQGTPPAGTGRAISAAGCTGKAGADAALDGITVARHCSISPKTPVQGTHSPVRRGPDARLENKAGSLAVDVNELAAVDPLPTGNSSLPVLRR